MPGCHFIVSDSQNYSGGFVVHFVLYVFGLHTSLDSAVTNGQVTGCYIRICVLFLNCRTMCFLRLPF